MYQFDEHNQMPWLWTLVPCNVIFEPLLYLPKRKKNLSSFDNCFRKSLVKSKAQQSRLCMCIKAFPERAAKYSIVTSWTSQWMELRWSCEVGLSGSTTCFLLPVTIKLSKYSQYSLSVCYLRFHTWLNFFLSKAFWWYFLHYIAYWQTLYTNILIQQMNNLDILNWLKNVLFSAECWSPDFNLIFTLHLTLSCYRLLESSCACYSHFIGMYNLKWNFFLFQCI